MTKAELRDLWSDADALPKSQRTLVRLICAIVFVWLYGEP